MIIMFTNLIRGVRKGKRVNEKNIWGGETLEWTIETPPIYENFKEIPVITDGFYEYKQNDVTEEEEVIH
jgi:cytochrome c oxidase subunit 1